MNALLCIGCNTYQSLKCLRRAEEDARNVFDLLSTQEENRPPSKSSLLLSPEASEITDTLNTLFRDDREIDVFTFFFAGHAAVRTGSFFLCTRESKADRLSTTAFRLIDLFIIINGFRPNQVNLIVDSCQAGGSSFDLSQLLKPEFLGSSQASSVSFLGACSSDQQAGETFEGGICPFSWAARASARRLATSQSIASASYIIAVWC
jgi:uncharacterized caspase-like protein